MEFKDYIGDVLLMLAPRWHPTELQTVKLLGVESRGLWVENQEMTNAILQRFKSPASPRSVVFFLPFAEIAFVIAGADAPSLDEKAFGL